MTNAVDILLVDGPAHATVVCAKRPVTTNIELPVEGVGMVQYVHREYCDLDGRWFHIATPPDSEVTDGFIDGTIFVLQFQPAWDLRDKPVPDQEQ